ncbi:MAG TPA: MarR family transcriptional regulator [Anaerolineales bacterium]|nr:MarR family transcriptional regulator [Anaerolineales bacterium]
MKKVKLDYSENAERIPGFLLWQVSKLWQRHLNAALRDLKLSSTQAIILGNIVRMIGQKKQVTQISLSEITKVDPMTTSQAIRTLEKKKLINRVVAKGDKRAFSILPTQQGVRVMMEALQRIAQAHEEFFRPLDKEINLFSYELQKLIQPNNL